MKPLLRRGGVSNRVYLVTRYKDLGDGRIEATKKEDVTDEFNALAHPVLDRSAAIGRDENEISLDDLDALAQFIQDHAPDEEPEALQFERILKWLEYRRAIHF